MSGFRFLRRGALVAALGIAAPLAAADFPTAPPPPGPAPELRIPAPEVQTLANGLSVISVRRSGVPLVTVQFLVRSGSEMDPPDEAGLAAFTASLLVRGAAGRSAPELAAAAEALGGTLEAGADWDGSQVSITVTTPRLAEALGLVASAVRTPDFAPEEIERARRETLDELRLARSQPARLAALVADRAVFGAGAYGHARLGTEASLARIQRADVARLHAALYRPDNAVLVLVGDITPAAARSLAEASFGDWVKPLGSRLPLPAGKARGKLPPLLLVDQPGAGQAGVVAAHLAPPRGDAEHAVGEVANAVLGGSYSARLNQEIRIKRGLSYGASSSFLPRRAAGLWQARAQTRNDAAAEVVELMLGEFQRLGAERVPEAELAARKATLIGAWGRSLETTAGLAAELGALAIEGIAPETINQEAAAIAAVTPKAVQKYAQRHLGGGASVVVVGHAADFAPALQKAHPAARRVDAADLDLDRADLGLK